VFESLKVITLYLSFVEYFVISCV